MRLFQSVAHFFSPAVLLFAGLLTLRAQTPSERMSKAEQLLGEGACKPAYNELESILGAKTIGSLDTAQFNRLMMFSGEAEVCLGYYSNAYTYLSGPRVLATPALLYLRAETEKGMGRYSEAEADYAKAAGASPLNSPDMAGWIVRAKAGAGDLSRLRGSFSEASTRIEESLALADTLPPDSVARAFALLAAADLARDREEFAEADALYQRVRRLADARGANHWLSSRASLGLGLIALSLGDLETAELELKRANEATHQKMPNSDVFLHTSAAMAMLGLARGEQSVSDERTIDRIAKAEEDLQDLVTSETIFRAKEHPDTARALSYLGVVRLARNQPERGMKELTTAEDVQRRLLKSMHPDLAFTLMHLGRAYQKQGKSVEAKRFLDDALAIQEAILGKDSLAATATRLELAALSSPADSAENEAVYRRALVVLDALHSQDSALRMRVEHDLGLLLYTKGRIEDAAPLLEKWLRGKGQSLPSTDNERLRVDFTLAEISLATHNFPVAEGQFANVLKGAGGGTRQFVAAARKGLADALFGQRKFQDAAATYEGVIGGMEVSPATANAWLSLSTCYTEQKRWEEGMKAAQKAFEVVEKVKSQPSNRYAILYTILTASIEAGKVGEAAADVDRWLAAKTLEPSISTNEAHLSDRLSRELFAAGQFALAEKVIRLILSSRDSLSIQGIDVNDFQLRLAETYVAERKYEEAAWIYESQSRRMRTLQRLAESEALLVKALELREKSPDELKLIGTKQALAHSYLLNRKYDQARTLFEETLQALRTRQDTAVALYGAALDGLGSVEQSQRHFEQARNYYDQARVALLAPGANAPPAVLASVLFHIGDLKASSNDMKGANEAFEACLALSKSPRAENEMPPIEQFDSIAGAYLSQKKFDDAEKLYLENLDQRRKFFGENSSGEAWGYYSLAIFYGARESYEKRTDYGQRSLKLFAGSSGTESEESALTLSLLAHSYAASNHLDDAVEAITHAERIQRTLLQPPSVISGSLSGLGEFQTRRKNYSEAREAYRKMEELWRPESFRNPNYQMAVSHLAASSALLKDFTAAHEWYGRLFAALQNDPVQLSKAAHLYADALSASGKGKDAKKILDQASARPATPAR